MRYERLELDLSTAACHELVQYLATDAQFDFSKAPASVAVELSNFYNELCARLQRRDPDPKCPKNLEGQDPNADLLR